MVDFWVLGLAASTTDNAVPQTFVCTQSLFCLECLPSSQHHTTSAKPEPTLGCGLLFLVNESRSAPQTAPGLCSLHWRSSSLSTQTMPSTHLFPHSNARIQPGTKPVFYKCRLKERKNSTSLNSILMRISVLPQMHTTNTYTIYKA